MNRFTLAALCALCLGPLASGCVHRALGARHSGADVLGEVACVLVALALAGAARRRAR